MDGEDLESYLLATYGICIKKLDSTVEFQNDLCLKLCGNQLGQQCQKGCMLKFQQSEKAPSLDLGSYYYQNIDLDGTEVDAVVLNNGEKVTTLLSPKINNIQKQLEFLRQFKLSKSETNVVRCMLTGLSNQEIAEKLFISRATLKTHLNNIYKKLPEEVKAKLLQNRSATEK